MTRIEVLTEPDSAPTTGASTPTEPKIAGTLEPDTTIRAPPADGGLVAWVQVLGSWCVLFCTFGLVNSFGVYQAYYEATLEGVSASAISWVGSIQGALLLCCGVVSGPLFDAGYFRHLLWSGLSLVVAGQLATSFCVRFWQVVLAQGVCIGLGCGLVFGPCSAVIAQYFSRRRALASGVVSMGSPVAGIVLPIVFSALQPRVGAAWATRVIALILLAISAVPLAFLRARLPPTQQEKQQRRRIIIDPAAFRDLPFMTFVIGGFFAFVALYIPFFYIELFAVDRGLARPAAAGASWTGTASFPASYMVAIMNAGSVVGRVVPPWIADRTRQPVLVMATSALACAALAFGWLGVGDSFPALVVFAVLYGAISGGVVGMQSAGTFALTDPRDMGKVGARLGMACFAAGLALLVGTPIAGVILGGEDGKGPMKWTGVIGFTADLLLVAAGFLFVTVWLVFRAVKRQN